MQFRFNEKKMQSKCILRVVDDDIESPYKIVRDIFDFFKQSCEHCFITLLTPHVGCHGACCVTSYDTSSKSPYDVIKPLWVQSQEFADWLKFSQWQLP